MLLSIERLVRSSAKAQTRCENYHSGLDFLDRYLRDCDEGPPDREGDFVREVIRTKQEARHM